MTQPIFILASERSGTNLLRTRLTAYQKTAFGPSPPHFLKHLYHKEPFYGDLHIENNFLSLVQDAITLCRYHFSPWECPLDPKEIVQGIIGERNVIKLMDYLYKKYANYKGFKSYICKDNNLFDYCQDIKYFIPSSKFIYLYRDPRDYSLSQLKRTRMTSNLLKISLQWSLEQEKCIKFVSDKRFSDSVLLLSYEDFILNESHWLSKICTMFDLETVQFVESSNYCYDLGGTEEWANLSKPTMNNNYNKYKAQLSRNEIRIIESICWNPLKYLGYTPENSIRPHIPRWAKLNHSILALSKDGIGKLKARALSDHNTRRKRADFINRLPNV